MIVKSRVEARTTRMRAPIVQYDINLRIQLRLRREFDASLEFTGKVLPGGVGLSGGIPWQVIVSIGATKTITFATLNIASVQTMPQP